MSAEIDISDYKLLLFYIKKINTTKFQFVDTFHALNI